MRALVVGGTGPTGHFIVNGLLERGWRVTIFHRGTHEVPEIPVEVEHIHGDPHFTETINGALAGRTFDLTIASYGRLRLLAAALAGQTGRFIGIGGFSAYRGWYNADAVRPRGLISPVPEDAMLVAGEQEHRFSWLIAESEKAVFAHHPRGTVFRYPYVYGPYQIRPREWSIIRRLNEGRQEIIVPHYGMHLSTHGWAGNLAHAVLLAVDKPEAAAGKVYNCGDLEQLTLAQVVEVIADALGKRCEIVPVAYAIAGPHQKLALAAYGHQLMDLSRIRRDLGYKDLLGVREALARTTRWYVDNPPPAGGDIERALGDPFDYAEEDRFISAHREASALMASVYSAARTSQSHPYAHPREAGAQRDQKGR